MKASRRQVLATLAAVPALALVGNAKAKSGHPQTEQAEAASVNLTSHRWGVVAALLAADADDEVFQVAYGEAIAQTMETVEALQQPGPLK